MGTLFRIKLYAADADQARDAFRAAFTRISELDNDLSDYKPDSELNKITSEAVHRPVPVSADLFRVLSAAQSLAEKTDGAFDITIGALTHLWRDARKANRMPDNAAVAEARARCGFRLLHLDPAHQTVELERPDMQLDAGAIAKGDAADEALKVLSARGIRSALVAASGDLAFSDAPPGESGWKIGLDAFDTPASPFTRVLRLTNAAVSTSGPTEQHINSGGKQYSHIINPRSGLGLTHEITASVVARRGIEADSFATAVSVLGEQRGLAFIESQRDASAVILTTGADGKPQIIESSRFAKPIAP